MDLQSNKKLSALVVNIANPMQILASALTGEHLLSNGETLRLAGLIALIYLALIALSFPAVRLSLWSRHFWAIFLPVTLQ